MGVYRYCCRICETEFELEQNMNHEPPAECSICGEKAKLVRLPFAQVTVFKTYGFYKSRNKPDP